MGKGMLFVTILMIVGCGRHSRVLAGTITVYLAMVLRIGIYRPLRALAVSLLVLCLSS
jgi:hypothetical protein